MSTVSVFVYLSYLFLAVTRSWKYLQVVKVERLENPFLWEQYKHRREILYLSHGCSNVQPIEKLPGSQSPVLTTANLTRGSPLRQQIYPAEVRRNDGNCYV